MYRAERGAAGSARRRQTGDHFPSQAAAAGTAGGRARYRVAATPPPGFRMQRRNNFYRIDDPANNLYRWASSGHWSNYDEAEAGNVQLPDPLRLANGQRVTDAKTWFEKRRPEIVRLYETEIYGKVPANAPRVKWEVTKTENNGATITREVLGRIGDAPAPPLEIAPAPGGRGGPIGPPAIRISLTLAGQRQGKGSGDFRRWRERTARRFWIGAGDMGA